MRRLKVGESRKMMPPKNIKPSWLEFEVISICEDCDTPIIVLKIKPNYEFKNGLELTFTDTEASCLSYMLQKAVDVNVSSK